MPADRAGKFDAEKWCAAMEQACPGHSGSRGQTISARHNCGSCWLDAFREAFEAGLRTPRNRSEASAARQREIGYAEGFEAGVEASAKVCDEQEDACSAVVRSVGGVASKSEWSDRRAEARDCAAKIRALLEKERGK